MTMTSGSLLDVCPVCSEHFECEGAVRSRNKNKTPTTDHESGAFALPDQVTSASTLSSRVLSAVAAAAESESEPTVELRLPLQSAQCSHLMCKPCLCLDRSQRDHELTDNANNSNDNANANANDQARRTWVACPICKDAAPQAFHIDTPIVSLLACQVLRMEAHQEQGQCGENQTRSNGNGNGDGDTSPAGVAAPGQQHAAIDAVAAAVSASSHRKKTIIKEQVSQLIEQLLVMEQDDSQSATATAQALGAQLKEAEAAIKALRSQLLTAEEALRQGNIELETARIARREADSRAAELQAQAAQQRTAMESFFRSGLQALHHKNGNGDGNVNETSSTLPPPSSSAQGQAGTVPSSNTHNSNINSSTFPAGTATALEMLPTTPTPTQGSMALPISSALASSTRIEALQLEFKKAYQQHIADTKDILQECVCTTVNETKLNLVRARNFLVMQQLASELLKAGAPSAVPHGGVVRDALAQAENEAVEWCRRNDTRQKRAKDQQQRVAEEAPGSQIVNASRHKRTKIE